MTHRGNDHSSMRKGYFLCIASLISIASCQTFKMVLKLLNKLRRRRQFGQTDVKVLVFVVRESVAMVITSFGVVILGVSTPDHPPHSGLC